MGEQAVKPFVNRSEEVAMPKLDPVHYAPLIEQVYPGASTHPSVRAEIAFDERRAEDVKTVVNVVNDDKLVEQVSTNFVLALEEKVRTGAIDLPEGLSSFEQAGVVARVLVEDILLRDEREVNVDEVLLENTRLEIALGKVTVERDKLKSIATVEAATEMIAAAEQETEAMRARLEAAEHELAELKKANPVEKLRQSFKGIKLLGQRVADLTVVH